MEIQISNERSFILSRVMLVRNNFFISTHTRSLLRHG